MATTQEDKLPPQNVAPLSFDELLIFYPNTYRQYEMLSNREQSFGDDDLDSSDDDEDNRDVDDEDHHGLCTTITSVDFLELLYENQMSNHLSAQAYKFLMFLLKMLDACESGSIGGEACRMMFTLTAALADVEGLLLDDTTTNNGHHHHHHHLLAWTIATYSHGIHPLLYRGEPEAIQELFADAGRLWKEVFKSSSSLSEEKTRKFAMSACENLRELLAEAKEEYGEHADYKFAYITKTRKRKV